MSKLKLLLVAMSIFTFSPVASAFITPRTPFATKQNGRLKGVVLDSFSGRGVARAQVVVEGSVDRHTAVTDKDGSYSIELPSDVYQVKAIRPGFCSAQRAEFLLPSSSSIEMNFTLVACAIKNSPIVEDNVYKGEIDRKDEPFKYDSFPVESSPNEHFTLLLRFGEKQEKGNDTEYSGSMVGYLVSIGDRTDPVEEHKYLQVMVSYNTLTINADKVMVNKQRLQIVAEGNVLVEDGVRGVVAKRAVVDFDAGKPTLKLER